MTSRDDRFLEMLTDSQFDDAIELMLRGIVVEPDLDPVARFADEAGALADASPPAASPELAALLAGEPLADRLLSVGATRAAAIARTCLPERGPSRRSGGAVVARTPARVAAMSLAAKAGLGLALAGAGAAGSGAAAVLPDSVVDAVRHTIEVVTPFELPDRASAGATTGAADDPGSTAEATGSRPTAPDESESPIREPTGSDAGTGARPGASDTPRPGDGTGATSPTAESPGPVDPPATVPPLDDTPTPPASPPGHEQSPPDPAGAPHPDGRPSRPGDANPNPGGLPNEGGNPNPDHSPTPNACGLPNEAANAAGPSLGVTTASSGGLPSGKVADLHSDGSSCCDAAGDVGGIVDGTEPREPACRVAGLRL